MQAKVDRFGRVVIPKRIRDESGLEAGQILEVERQSDQIVLKPAREKAAFKYRNGILVYTGKITGPIADIVKKDRAARIRKLMGLDEE